MELIHYLLALATGLGDRHAAFWLWLARPRSLATWIRKQWQSTYAPRSQP
jgi:hypothetical protein